MAEKTGIEELRVKEILKERGMKMYELAETMGIAPESLTRALQRNPQYSTLKTIADTLGVSVRDLFKGDDTQASNNEMRGCIFYGGEMYTFNSRKEIEKFLIDTK
jgi:transcriptional regulator with XRE-family HTH domain